MDEFLGTITKFGGNFAPRGYALCNGQLLEINEHQALFSLIEFRYGGDGHKKFALPDLRPGPHDGEAWPPGTPVEIIRLIGVFPSPDTPLPETPGDELLGMIKSFAGTFAPSGYALCDGRLLPISPHTALFSILGTMYGGDGKTNFALPDLRAAPGEQLPVQIICMQGRFPSHP